MRRKTQQEDLAVLAMEQRESEEEASSAQVQEENPPVQREEEYSERLEGEPLNYYQEVQVAGGDLFLRGQGSIMLVTLHCIHNYSCLKRKSNKKIFIKLLQDSSQACEVAEVLSYCVLDDCAVILIKGNREESVKAFIKLFLVQFERRYNSGLRNVGNPFREPAYKNVFAGTLENEIKYVHSLSPQRDVVGYPFNSYVYIMEGVHDANLILNIELGINSERGDCMLQMKNILEDVGYAEVPTKGRENYEKVSAELMKSELGYQETYPEKKLDFVLGETASRTETPYFKVARKLRLEKRYDIMVSTVCDYIMRHGSTYFDTVANLSITDSWQLRMEVLAEINRVYHFSYEYIITHIICQKDESGCIICGDENYDLLVSVFLGLHKKYDLTFEQLCVRFHITKDFYQIRSLCGF